MLLAILQGLHNTETTVYMHCTYDRKERVPQLHLCRLVVPGGTSVRTCYAKKEKDAPVTCTDVYINFS